MTTHAQHAVKAAKLRYCQHIGRWAARRYCERRGVPMGLYRLACQLEAASKIN